MRLMSDLTRQASKPNGPGRAGAVKLTWLKNHNLNSDYLSSIAQKAGETAAGIALIGKPREN